MKRIAIVSFGHAESALCLAKYIGQKDLSVDFYYINKSTTRRKVPGFEFCDVKVNWGLQEINKNEIPEISSYINNDNVRIFLITYNSSRRYSIWGLDKITLWSACLKIKRQHYDAIDIVGQEPHVVWCHNYLKGCNLIHTYHEVGSHEKNISSTLSVDVSIRDYSKVIFHSNSTLQRFLLLKGANNIKSTVIPFGKFETSKLYVKDIEMNIPLDLSKPTFLFYGFIKPYKGLDILRQAVMQMDSSYDSFNLIIAGGGNDDNLEFFKALKNCFVLNRFLENNEMMHLIKISSAIVLPYHTASQTGIIPTVALYGKPVISTAVGAFPEIVIDHVNGLLVEPENYKLFAEAMKMCIFDKSLLNQLEEGMKKFGVGDKYDWNIIATKTYEFILNE